VSNRYSIAAARSSLPALVHAVEEGPPVEITRRGRPVAILLSIGEYHRMNDKKPDLWAAIQRFRETVDLEALDVDEIYSDVRDRSPGRETEP
jgi:prevent-host-death family protein